VDLEKQKAVQQNQIENLRRDVERTLADVAMRRTEMEGLDDQNRRTGQGGAGAKDKIGKLDAAEEKRRTDIATTERDIEAMTKKLADHNRILDAKRNEYKLTKSMVESLEGFPESIKFLSQQKDWAKNCPCSAT
jgi:chromosome segregation protein